MSLITIETDDSRIVIEPRRAKLLTQSLNVTVDQSGVTHAIEKALAAAKVDARFTKVAADGTELPAGDKRTDHVAVIDHTTGLMWSVESLGDPADENDGVTQEHCIERCKQLRLLDHEDWRLPTRSELAGLIDDTRHEPAIDVEHFPRVKPRWHWTSTPAAWSSASAWGVYFDLGYVSHNRSYDHGFALAVRRAGQ